MCVFLHACVLACTWEWHTAKIDISLQTRKQYQNQHVTFFFPGSLVFRIFPCCWTIPGWRKTLSSKTSRPVYKMSRKFFFGKKEDKKKRERQKAKDLGLTDREFEGKAGHVFFPLVSPLRTNCARVISKYILRCVLMWNMTRRRCVLTFFFFFSSLVRTFSC